ncbi:hypothetical protein VF21_08650, partial [Pseudogymnoascus sp. 05NY08]
MSGLLLYVMFLQYNFICDLNRDSSNGAGTSASASIKDKVITLMRQEDEVMLIDKIILPAIYKAVQSANILQHYPTSAALIKANALAGSKEQYVKVSHSYKQFLFAPTSSMFTFAAAPSSQAFQDRYVYGQFYNLVKGPFNAAKVYIFNNDSLETIALNPAYVQSLHKVSRAAAFSQKACLTSYLYSKTRAHVNLADSDVFAFIRAQLNKYCLLFKHVLTWTNETHLLPEFIMILLWEALLYKDQWRQISQDKPVVLEGLGIAETIAAHGISWFMAKINWQTLQYQQRWRAVRDLQDVYIQLGQADEWFVQHHITDHDSASAPSGRYRSVLERVKVWLSFLHRLNLNQFDHNVATVMQRSHRAHPKLAQDYGVAQLSRLSFCLAGM